MSGIINANQTISEGFNVIDSSQATIKTADYSTEFPQHESICYLNHAAVSPWPKRTLDAVTKFSEQNVTYGATYYPEWLKVEQELRGRLARLINAPSSQDIALSKSTSEALSIIAYGLNWSNGDEVLITNQEFPSNRIVWESLHDKGVSVKVANIDSGDPVNAIIAATNGKTKIISVSSVQYASGVSLDLEQLGTYCAKHKILLCIDAIQSLGAIPFDLEKNHADFVVADGHKWMLGPEGLALLYVSPSIREQLSLSQFGWHMVEHRGDYNRQAWQPANDATRFECGSPNMLGIHALNASLSLIEAVGIENINQRLQSITNYLIKQLQTIDGLHLLSPVDSHKRAGIVTFRLESMSPETLHHALMQAGVICACRGGGVRFSPHFYTSENTIDRAIAQIKTIISG